MSDETKPDVGVCDGCGSTKTLEELRASGHLSCCPERKMLSASEWKSRADNAEDEITRLRAENEMLREALLFYVDENNWKMNSPLDMNSGNFTGGPASAAIEGVTKKEGAGHE